MKKQILTFALSAFFGLGAAIAAPLQDQSAAPPQSGQHAWHNADPSQQVQRLTKRLNLTAAQQSELLPILTDRQQQMQSIYKDDSLSPADKHAKMRTAREASEARIRGILTDAQKQTYDQMQQQMRERMQQRGEQQQNSTQSATPNN